MWHSVSVGAHVESDRVSARVGIIKVGPGVDAAERSADELLNLGPITQKPGVANPKCVESLFAVKVINRVIAGLVRERREELGAWPSDPRNGVMECHCPRPWIDLHDSEIAFWVAQSYLSSGASDHGSPAE